MRIKLSAILLFLTIMPGQAHSATLTEAEATFLEQLVTAGAVLTQRCTGYEVDGSGGVKAGARLLGSPNAAMAMIDAFDAAIKAHDRNAYDARKFRPEVFEAASKMSERLKASFARNQNEACAAYGDSSVERGLLRRF